ncbi:MAG TPA: hypothetical protein VKB47_12710 [Terracidiphilus sp.]|nr:hypothetical protein [Terracidiphilus sp.]
MDTVAERFSETERLELEWISRLNEGELGRAVESRAMPGLTRLRAFGGTPATMDFVL